jgi:hypothetical protein
LVTIIPFGGHQVLRRDDITFKHEYGGLVLWDRMPVDIIVRWN